jgi:hypothetical protein
MVVESSIQENEQKNAASVSEPFAHRKGGTAAFPAGDVPVPVICGNKRP